MDPSLLSLPMEIIENVIDQATRDTKTLRNFALTCRDLLPRSRYHLFHSIRFGDVDQLYSFYDFLNLHPHVASFVISLALSATRGDPKSPLSLLQTIPTPLLIKLRNLCLWKIADPQADYREPRRWLSFTTHTLTCMRAHGAAIVELHLDSVSLPNCAHFAEYIMVFQCLKYLSCRSLRFKEGLDGLRFHLVKQRFARQLRLYTLNIGCDVADDAALALLESSPSTLLDLELHVQEVTELDVPSLISELHVLRSLTLVLELWEMDAGQTVRESALLRTFEIIEALSRHPKSRLQDIIIHLREVKSRPFHRMLSKIDPYPGLECFGELEFIFPRRVRLRNIEAHRDILRVIGWMRMLEPNLAALSRRKTATLNHLTPTRRQASHDEPVWFIAVSPDTEWVASSSYDQKVVVWDTHRQSIVHEWIAHSNTVSSLSFSPNSQYLATTGHDRKAVVWDIRGLGPKRVATLRGYSGEVYTCAWSPDGTLLATGSKDGTVRVWDTRTYQQLHSLQDPSGGNVQSVRFSPDGRWIASGGRSTSDCVVATPGALHAFLRGHRGGLQTAVFDLATRCIATDSLDSTVRIWDVKTGDALVVLEGHTDWVQDVVFSPDGRHVVAESYGRMVKVWDSFSSNLLLSLETHTEYVRIGVGDWRMDLNNFCQRHGITAHLNWGQPTRSGPQDAPTWTVMAYYNGVEIGGGSALSTGLARENAAESALRALWNMFNYY